MAANGDVEDRMFAPSTVTLVAEKTAITLGPKPIPRNTLWD
jgi:hypothetical protein